MQINNESPRTVVVATLFSACCFLAIPFTVVAQVATPAPPEVAAGAGLGGADRYLTHLSTDKPIYRSGDSLFARAILLHCKTHKPIANSVYAMLEIKGPKGESVARLNATTQDGVAGFTWQVPAEIAGGQYIAKLVPSTGDAPVERPFEIRAYRPPRLRSQINFLSKGYGAGENVMAYLKTERSEGGVPADAKVTIIARIDDSEVHRSVSTIDDKGNCLAQFELPDLIERGEGTLAMIIEDGGVVETASKTIPILLQHVDVNVYPEGGELVAGFENRVYLEAFTPANKPADIAGLIVDQNGNEVGSFATEHEGRGRFRFTPKPGRSYFLKIQKPTGIVAQHALPKVKDDGVTVSTTTDVFTDDEKIAVQVTASSTIDLIVTISHRGEDVESVDARVSANEPRSFRFDATGLDGVFAVTVRTRHGLAKAERLVFRRPSRQLNVVITPDSDQYVPGGKAKLTITTTDQGGKPVEGFVGLTVTDDSVLELIETRDQAPRLPAMVFLEHDVRDLADAHVYFDPNNENAPRAIDLLLGTQGWRRFVTVDIKKAIANHGDQLKRALAYRDLTVARRSNRSRARDFFGVNEEAVDGLREFDNFAKENVVELAAEIEPINQPAAALQVEQDAEKRIALPNDDGREQNVRRKQLAQQPAENAFRGHFNRQRRLLKDADVGQNFEDIVFFERMPVVQVREFAFKLRANRQSNERVDFTETLFWSAATKTDSQGKATIEFDLNDSVTSFKVMADGFSSTGAVGASTAVIESVEPFYVEPKLPLEVTSGDFLEIPLSLVNATSASMDEGRLSVKSNSWKSFQNSTAPFSLSANQRDRKILGVRVGGFHGEANLTVDAAAGAYSDQVTRKLIVKPQGFPIQNAFGGIIQANSQVEHVISIPDSVVPGSVVTRIAVHPSPLASMTEALAGLIREPHGCFEQTSSSNFPMVMAQQYFQSHVGVDPELITRNAGLLEKGYKKLVGFECKNKGFEWFGSDPGHDALTAYGLLEFKEMAKVQHVDAEMIARTTEWLLSQRDGKGGYLRKTHTLHTWIADPECANCYNTWALLEADVDADLKTEIEWVRQAATASKNSYVLALAANAMVKSNDPATAKTLCKRLASLLQEDGSVGGATTSVVGSQGDALAIETTALAISAWLQFAEFTPQVERSIKFLSERCKAGRFGSTQSTILALRAIIRYDQSRAKPKAAGQLQVLVNGKQVGDPLPFEKTSQESLELPNVAGLLSPGKHQIQIAMTDGAEMPYSVAIEYHSLTPDSSKDCNLTLDVKLNDSEMEEGSITEARIVVANRTKETLPTPIAIIGIPGGLEVRHEQLKELKSEGLIAAYEVVGREVILYWRAFQPDHRIDLPINLIAAVPGEYSAPASRVYQYYTDEHKQWVAGPSVTISAK